MVNVILAEFFGLSMVEVLTQIYQARTKAEAKVEIGIFVLALLVRIMVSAVSLWLAMKITKEEGNFLLIFAAASIAAVVGLLPVPYIGSVVSYIVLLVLISKWTTAEIWPDAVLMTVVASFLSSLAAIAIRSILH